MRLVPAATATGHSPLRSTWTAWWTATRLDEQAVSMVMDGPCQLKKYETRLDIILRELPVAAYVGICSLSA